ncbi:hypothetical protein AN639_09180 [Candidatus Epulonipiscium fishelsonii]|uniref:Uncharacterized protein n=1 Tax=Candidatus Epulonipiscium fishelsonii TaxID=77094 RepID=A0ACC8XDS5_9FIRM|nr:hypothetical protein AN639_09180 [Epulopiscium sp. SCG-B05WGA-EpuloA1]ONI41019.1 hypothetical protein AN396_04465 [Epulopiscium sp. SCG-B11WGA-EpuloA1]
MNYNEGELDISLEDMYKLEHTSYILLDIRSSISFNLSNIEGSINIPKDKIDNRINELLKDKLIIVYCTIGIFAKDVTKKLRKHGYEASNLTNGYSGWLVKKFKE